MLTVNRSPVGPEKTDEVADDFDRFYKLFFDGTAAFQAAGDHLVRLIDKYGPGAKTTLMERWPQLTADVLATFERIGRKQLHPSTFLNESPGRRALRRCPYSEQVKYSEEPIEFLLLKDGVPETILVSIDSLTDAHAKQVFGSRRVRTLGEQRLWLEDQLRKAQNKVIVPQNSAPIHVVRGDQVILRCNGVTLALTRRQLLDIAHEIAK